MYVYALFSWPWIQTDRWPETDSGVGMEAVGRAVGREVGSG